jgi:hypothetical protein
MDDLQLLRETRNDVGTVPPAVLARGRDRLMKRAEAEAAAGEQHNDRTLPVRRPWRRAAMATAAAAVIAASFVVADVVGAGDHPGASAEAAEVLGDAATTTIATSDPVVGPGQYLLVDTTAVYGAYTSNETGEYVWLESQDGQMYVPADLSAEWVWNREPRVPVQFFDEQSQQLAESQLRDGLDAGELLRGPAGNFYGSGPSILGNIPLEEALGSAPRDPRELLDLIYEQTYGSGPTTDEAAFNAIADTLRSGVIPADLRAALYGAAALVPGVSVIDPQATMDGRVGISLGMDTRFSGSRTEIIIDPQSGLVIGEREVLLAARDGVPAGTVVSWTAITTSVVDEAP